MYYLLSQTLHKNKYKLKKDCFEQPVLIIESH